MSRLPKKLPLAGIENIILVGSGKGGVGKSTTSACAMLMNNRQKKIGLLDADVFGPSIPKMMNLKDKPSIDKRNLIKPLTNYGISCMSIGLMTDKKKAVIWRGLMVMSAIEKLLFGVDWGGLHYLIIDLPPGTGDVQLTIAQRIPVSGAILVTTPQEVAQDDVYRAASMFETTGIQILGVILNMSFFTCEYCNCTNTIFGTNQIQPFLERLKTKLLGNLQLYPKLSDSSDAGTPFVVLYPNHLLSKEYCDIASKICKQLPPPLCSIS